MTPGFIVALLSGLLLCAQAHAAADGATALERERRDWLADKRSDPLDLDVEREVARTRLAVEGGDCAAAVELATGVLARHPFQLGALDALVRCGGPAAAPAAAAKRDAIVALIEGSGRGDVMSGWKVISWTEPFEFLRLKGLRSDEWRFQCERTQQLVVSSRNAQGKVAHWVFDIHALYRACRTRVACKPETRGIPCEIGVR